jgi:hypothetical protein
MDGWLLHHYHNLERLDWGSRPPERTDAQNRRLFFLASFRTTFDFDGDPNNKRIPLLLLLSLLLLGDTTFWRTQKTKEAAADIIMTTPAFLQTWHSHTKHELSIFFSLCERRSILKVNDARVLDKEETKSSGGRKRAFQMYMLIPEEWVGRFFVTPFLFSSFVCSRWVRPNWEVPDESRLLRRER